MLGERKILEVHDLRIVYRTDLSTVYAVNGVTFSMNKGETLGLVGRPARAKQPWRCPSCACCRTAQAGF